MHYYDVECVTIWIVWAQSLTALIKIYEKVCCKDDVQLQINKAQKFGYRKFELHQPEGFDVAIHWSSSLKIIVEGSHTNCTPSNCTWQPVEDLARFRRKIWEV
jgi:hypothetical protein